MGVLRAVGEMWFRLARQNSGTAGEVADKTIAPIDRTL